MKTLLATFGTVLVLSLSLPLSAADKHAAAPTAAETSSKPATSPAAAKERIVTDVEMQTLETLGQEYRAANAEMRELPARQRELQDELKSVQERQEKLLGGICKDAGIELAECAIDPKSKPPKVTRRQAPPAPEKKK